jgi:hypothetical protein
MFVPDPDFSPILDPDSGSKGQKSTGFRIRIRNIDNKTKQKHLRGPLNYCKSFFLLDYSVTINIVCRVDGAVVERREEFQQLGDSFSHQAAWPAFPLTLHFFSL